MFFSVHDSATVWLSKSHVKERSFDPPAQVFHTNQSIKGFKGLSWSLRVYRVPGPAIRIDLGVSSGSVKAVVVVTVGSETKHWEGTIIGTSASTVCEYTLLNNCEENFVLNLEVQFDISEYTSDFKMPNLSVVDLVADFPQDVEFCVAEGSVKAHRGFLSLISPVFRAMFTHDTKESKTGVIDVTDFDIATVINVMNLCYGQNSDTKSTSDVIAMLVFADKYDIKTVVTRLEDFIEADINSINFCVIAKYAWDFDRNNLKTTCAKFYRQNPTVSVTPGFAQMGASVQLGVIASAVSVDDSDQ